jgi:uncharacterized protein (TIGR00251 family)
MAATRICVYVQPGASKTQIAGMHDGLIKVRVAAPPVEGAANQALVEFLAKRLRIPKSRVRVVSGLTSRRKVLEIEGVSQDAIAASLQ